MADDLEARLRGYVGYTRPLARALMDEAADTIATLRAEKERLKAALHD